MEQGSNGSEGTPPAPSQTDGKSGQWSSRLAFSQSFGRFLGLFKGKKTLTRQEFYESIMELDLEKQAETLMDASEGWESFGWEFVTEEEGVTITRCSVPNSSTKCTRGIAVLKGSPKEVFDVVRDAEIYKQWDPERVVQSKFVHQLNPRTSTCYFEFAPYHPVAARDVCFLQYLTKYRDGTYVVSWQSVDDPAVPRKKGVVRATMGTSGFVIAPFSKSSKSLVTFVLQFDLNGWIPSILDQAFTASQPMLLLYVDAELKRRQEQAEQEAASQPKAEANAGQDAAPSKAEVDAHVASGDDDPDLQDMQRKIRENQERSRRKQCQPSGQSDPIESVHLGADPADRRASQDFVQRELDTVGAPDLDDENFVYVLDDDPSDPSDPSDADVDADSLLLQQAEEMLALGDTR
eukprot:TRINITY_DN2935_c1_g1_i1.p1 TRINITY_DN2935_c1_g1~~TRINITY_DN2935_c1_g1_i1.p1  ORF type:complete len:406 (-),score=111.93 TRINITY_DN2935_c1_g1_i1:326-1543(-)